MVTDSLAFTVDKVLLTKMRATFPKATGLRDVANGTPFMYTYLAKPWSPGSLWGYPGDSQERNSAIALIAEMSTTQRPSDSDNSMDPVTSHLATRLSQ